MENYKYIVAGKQVVRLCEASDGLWRDDEGCIYADSDNGKSQDSYDGCGVTPWDLPDWGIFNKLNAACKIHDFKYNSKTWQMFNTRAEADYALQKDIQNADAGGIFWMIGRLFKNLAREFGQDKWENPATND